MWQLCIHIHSHLTEAAKYSLQTPALTYVLNWLFCLLRNATCICRSHTYIGRGLSYSKHENQPCLTFEVHVLIILIPVTETTTHHMEQLHFRQQGGLSNWLVCDSFHWLGWHANLWVSNERWLKQSSRPSAFRLWYITFCPPVIHSECTDQRGELRGNCGKGSKCDLITSLNLTNSL